MELKDVILSTLAEMEESPEVIQKEPKKEPEVEKNTKVVTNKQEIVKSQESVKNSVVDNELLYLNSIRERMLVLFEGFQAPNNSNLEAKIDMTLNFLEYTLATIDNRVEKLEKGFI